MENDITINLSSFKKMLMIEGPEKYNIYHNIFQSFAKRVEYCKVYYSQFEEATTLENIRKDFDPFQRILSDDPDKSRLIFESATLSFLQNLHALCDTLSFAVNEIALNKNKFKKFVYLNNELAEAVESEYTNDDRLYKLLHDLVNDKEFIKLKAYVNLAKHAQLVDIINNGKQLSLAEFKYFNGTSRVTCEKTDLGVFMQEIHLHIVSKVMNVYIMMQTMLKEKYENR